jgi:hypothetical protein
MSLADAIREVAENPPPALNLRDHEPALRGLGELLDELDRQREADQPAA